MGQSCWALHSPFPMNFANSPKRTCRPLQPRLQLRIGETSVDLLIEFVDDAWDELAHGRDVRQPSRRAAPLARGARLFTRLSGGAALTRTNGSRRTLFAAAVKAAATA